MASVGEYLASCEVTTFCSRWGVAKMLIVDKDKQEAIKITDCKIKVISGKKKIKKEIKKHRKRVKQTLLNVQSATAKDMRTTH